MTDVFILYTIHYLDIHSQQERMAFTIPTVSTSQSLVLSFRPASPYNFDGDSDTTYRFFDLLVKLGAELSGLLCVRIMVCI